MSAELTVAIQTALAASQGLGWDTVRTLEGGVWLTADEIEQARRVIERDGETIEFESFESEAERDEVLASLPAPAPEEQP